MDWCQSLYFGLVLPTLFINNNNNNNNNNNMCCRARDVSAVVLGRQVNDLVLGGKCCRAGDESEFCGAGEARVVVLGR